MTRTNKFAKIVWILLFKEVFELSRLILTIPNSTASAERAFPAPKRVITYLRVRATQNHDCVSSLSCYL